MTFRKRERNKRANRQSFRNQAKTNLDCLDNASHETIYHTVIIYSAAITHKRLHAMAVYWTLGEARFPTSYVGKLILAALRFSSPRPPLEIHENERTKNHPDDRRIGIIVRASPFTSTGTLACSSCPWIGVINKYVLTLHIILATTTTTTTANIHQHRPSHTTGLCSSESSSVFILSCD